MLLEGIFPAVTTPFYPDGRLYLRKLEQNMERYSRAPVAGLVLLGSTGESVMLNDEESRQVLQTAVRAAAPHKVLIAGVGRESVQETLRLAEFAAGQRYDAVLVRTPHYFGSRTTPAAMLNHYRMVADRSPLPVVLYSVPRFTHYELPIEVVAELAQHPNIVGIKDSINGGDRIAALVAATAGAARRKVTVTPLFEAVTARMSAATATEPTNLLPVETLGGGTGVATAPPAQKAIATRTKEVGFQVLTGSPQTVKSSLDAGAAGAMLAMAACAPQACQEIYTAWKDHDLKLAEEKQARLNAASARVAGALGVAGVKYACELNGYYGGPPRLPLLPLTAAERAEVESAMASLRS